MKKLKEILSDLINTYPLYTGGALLLIGLLWFLYKIYKRESFKMNDYNVAGWKAMVNSWSVIILLIILGTTLIIRN